MTDTPSLRRSFRLVCNPGQIPSVEALLSAQGFVFEPEPFSPLARRLLQEPFPLGRSLAAFWGYVYIQDRSSMLPPLALAPDEGARVLDMCASPGSKTGLLAQLVGREGLVLGNEPARPRLANLRRNLAALNLLQAVTCSWPGESLPLPDASWDAVLLDPPCSGWGTTDKNPQAIKRWQGDRLKPMLDLQRKLLTEASRLLRPGGKLVYSTCTTNVDENEGQVRFAVEGLGLEPIPLEPFPGFVFAAPELPGCEGTLRVDEGTLGLIFYDAWQLSAVTEEEERARFFTKIFRTYSSVLFCCAAGIIWLCRPVMHVMKSNYYYAWHFVPFLVLASTCSCFNQFMNSVYVVTKKSQRSMVTMMAGAISNCIMNYFFIKLWGPVGATYASFLGLALVFTLRAVDARRMIGMRVHPARVLANAAVLVFEAFVLLAEPPLYGLWTGLITLVIILYNFAGVWAMARVLLPRLLGRRGKALVAAVDGWLKPKKA